MSGRRFRSGAVSAALVLVLVLGAGLVWRSVHTVADAHPAPQQFAVAPSRVAPVIALRPSTPRPSRPTSRAAAAPTFTPGTLTVDRLHIGAAVTPLTITGQALVPPSDPRQLGWWRGSSLAGADTGSTVIVGHVDSAERGLGAFYRLDDVRPGDRIVVRNGARSMSYRVDSLRLYVKTTGLPETLFASAGAPRLVLISCGGSFDRVRRSYRDNVVVTAAPSA